MAHKTFLLWYDSAYDGLYGIVSVIISPISVHKYEYTTREVKIQEKKAAVSRVQTWPNHCSVMDHQRFSQDALLPIRGAFTPCHRHL